MKKFKFLGLLSVFSLLFTCFWYCDFINWLTYVWNITNNDTSSVYYTTFGDIWFPDVDSLFCIYVKSANTQYTLSIGSNLDNIRLRRSDFWCFYYWEWSQSIYLTITNSNWNAGVVFDFDIYSLPFDFSIISWDPVVDMSVVKDWVIDDYSIPYDKKLNLYLDSNIDYTFNQWVSYSFELESVWWICTWWLSTLYINDIRHQSMPFIYVNIPEEFNWDYSTWINDFTIDVEWYNTDSNYIAWIIDTQKNKPSQSDFNNIITEIIPLFVPWLVIILFIYFVFRFLKKIF